MISNFFKTLKNIGKPSQTIIESQKQPKVNTNTMAARVVLNNGLHMPRIGLGTFGIKEKAVCHKVFSEAVSCGYRLFDTGTLYGNDEYIGDVVYDKLSCQEIKRDDIFIETKIAPWEHGKENTQNAVIGSLKRLKLSYLDLVLVHWPGVAKVPPKDQKNRALRKETWEQLESLVSEGKIKSIGVSNYTENHLEDLLGYCKIKPTVNMVEFHPLCYQKNLLSFCQSNSIYLQAYSSLGSSQSKPPGWTVLFNDETVKSIATKHGRPIPQILLRWGMQHDCLLIPKTSRVENLKPNLDIFDFSLDDDDMSKLNALNQDKHFCWNPKDIL